MIPKNENARQFAILACKAFSNFSTEGSKFLLKKRRRILYKSLGKFQLL